MEPFVPFNVPFRSVSSSSLPNLLGESPLDQSIFPTSTSGHTHTPSPRPLDFLDPPRAKGKRGMKSNLHTDYAYILVSRREMAAEYSGTQHAEIRRREGRRHDFFHRGASKPVLWCERSSDCGEATSGSNLCPWVNGNIVLLSARSGRIYQRILRSIPWVL